MKRLSPNNLTLLLAHLAGGYGAFIPTILVNGFAAHSNWWIDVFLAPIFAPIYLALFSVDDFPHYHGYFCMTWAAYALPFAAVCLIRSRKWPVVPLAAIPLMMTLFVTALWIPRAIADSRPWRSPLQDKLAPDFTLTSLDGSVCQLSRERGHVVLIDFWSINCPPCLAELKLTTAKLADDPNLRARGLRVWTINDMDDADAIQKFMRDHHYDFNAMLYRAKNAFVGLYPQFGNPTTYLIGRDGTVRYSIAGFDDQTDSKLRAEIDAALK